MAVQDIIIAYFSAQGYTLWDQDIPEQLGYTPNLILEKDKDVKIFYVRDSTEKLREVIVQRISAAKRIPGKTLEMFIVFDSKPTPTDLGLCKLYNIGVFSIRDNNLQHYSDSKQIKGRIPRPQLPTTKIFFSSRQHLEERRIAKELVDLERDSHKIPIFANLVEDDQRYDNNIDDLWEIIEDVIDDSQYIVCILNEEYREIIDKEIRHALLWFNIEEILFFVKNSKEAKDAWQIC